MGIIFRWPRVPVSRRSAGPRQGQFVTKKPAFAGRAQRRFSWKLRVALEDHTQLEAKDGRVLDQAGAIGPDDILDNRLGVEPLVHLDAVVKLEHGLVDLGGASSFRVGDLLVEAVIAVGKGHPKLVLIAARNEPLVNQTGLEVEGQGIVVLRREVDQAEKVEARIAELRFRGL